MAKQKLAAAAAAEGDQVQVSKDGKQFRGVLMPHHAFSDPDVVVIKLKSGYNLGLRFDPGSTIEVVEKALERHPKPKRGGECKG
ncbi:MAG: Glu-tRNA(Gln) amidotransferase GatDE subunit D, partial [Methanomassiliicoccales archaeon]